MPNVAYKAATFDTACKSNLLCVTVRTNPGHKVHYRQQREPGLQTHKSYSPGSVTSAPREQHSLSNFRNCLLGRLFVPK